MALVGMARPGKAGLGYTPRSKQSQRPKPRVGKASPGRGGLGSKNPGINKPSFQKDPKPVKKARPKPVIKAQPAAPDSAYNDAVDRVTRKTEYSLSNLDDQESAIKRDFGIEDPTDPFSRANAMKQAFLAQRKGVSAGLASQGQLYSGAHERAIARTRRGEEEARHNLREAYNSAINNVGAERAGVKFASEEERAQAFEDWLARVPDAEDVAVDDSEAPAAKPAPAAAAAGGAPVLKAQGAQQPSSSSPAMRARQARQAERKSILSRAAAAQKAAKKGKKGPGSAPVASINRPVRPKPKRAARPKKGRK